MVFFSRERREYLGDKVGDVANLAAGALVFGQTLSEGRFSWWVVVDGLVIWTVLILSGMLLIRRGSKR